MASWRYEISLLVLKKYFTRSLGSPLKYFSTLEEKLRISARPCNILYVFFLFGSAWAVKIFVDFHCTGIRSVLEYCSPIFHHSLPDCLSERVQKRALSIIAPDKSCKHCLVSFGLSTLYDRRNDQCIKLFNSISSDKHKFACLLSPNHQGYYNTRQESVYHLPCFRTKSCKNSFKPAMCGHPKMLL